MPLPRKRPTPPQEARQIAPRPSRDSHARLPGRVVLMAIVRDESGSMSPWRQRQGEFIPQVAAHLIAVGGPKVGKLVYVLNCTISGEVVATDFAPLERAQDPAFVPDRQTPIGRGLKVVAEKCRRFLEEVAFPQEVTVRNFEVLIVSDLQATGESDEETEAGVEAFLAMARKFNAKVNVIGPDPEEMDEELAARLDISGRGVKYLDSDASSILDITFDSLMSATGHMPGGPESPIRFE